MDLIKSVEAEQMKQDLPSFGPGDAVKVHYRVTEGGRDRIQIYEGVILQRQGGGMGESFTVRRVSYGVGVERTFPLHSPKVTKIEVVRRGKVRRARLYYLRERIGKRARIKEKR